MAHTIIGLDIGSHSVKLVRLAVGREARIVGYDIQPLGAANGAEQPGEEHAEQVAADGPMAPDAAQRAAEALDDAPTQVLRRDELDGAPAADAAAAPGAAEPAQNNGEAELGEAPETRAPWQAAIAQLKERGALDDDALVVTFLPDNRAMSIRQPLPFGERSKVETILPHMLNDRLPVDDSKIVYDFQIVKKLGAPAPTDAPDAPAAEAIVGFARREEIGDFLGDLKELALNPALVGIPELLLSYALERCAPPGGTYALLDIGHRFTRLLVLQGRDPVVARSMEFGGEELTQAVAERFDASWEQAEHLKETRGVLLGGEDTSTDQQTEALQALSESLSEALRPFVRDVRRTLQSAYVKKQVQVDEVFICGGTSLLSGLADYLSAEFGVPVSPLPTNRLPGLDESAAGQLKLAMAASTALQQVDGRDEERLINLRQQEFSYRGKSSYLRSQLLKYGAAAALLFLLLVGMLWAQKMQLEAQRDAMHKALGEQTTTLFGEPVFSHSSIKARFTGEETSGNSFIPRISAYELYYQLSSHIPRELEVRMDRFEVDVERNIAQIYGETTSPQAVEELIDKLRDIECLADVRQEGELKIKSDSAVDFHLHISSECA